MIWLSYRRACLRWPNNRPRLTRSPVSWIRCLIVWVHDAALIVTDLGFTFCLVCRNPPGGVRNHRLRCPIGRLSVYLAHRWYWVESPEPEMVPWRP